MSAGRARGGVASRLGAAFADAAAWTALGAAAWRYFEYPLLPSAGFLTAFAFTTGLGIYLQKRLLGATLGDRVWGLQNGLQRTHLDSPMLTRAWATTMGIGLLTGAVTGVAVARWPLAQVEPPLRLSGAQPTDERDLSFFYLSARWPTEFQGRPVLYSLPYAKGVGPVFVPEVIAHWDGPEAKITLEGPRTPAALPSSSQVLACFRPGSPLACYGVRSKVLQRHLIEMRGTLGRGAISRIGVFETSQGATGVRIYGTNGLATDERYIFITPSGTHQTVRLSRLVGPSGDRARELFLSTLATARTDSKLTEGKAGTDELLSRVRLTDSADTQSHTISRLASVQALLLSKISLEPRSVDSYFHLGGTAYLLAQKARADKNPDWASVAYALLKSATLYTHDLAPTDPRTLELERLLKNLSP